MRVLKVEDIFQKKYAIRNGEIVESENGQYYTKQVAQYVLNDKNVKHGQSDVSAAARCVTSPAPIVIIISPA